MGILGVMKFLSSWFLCDIAPLKALSQCDFFYFILLESEQTQAVFWVRSSMKIEFVAAVDFGDIQFVFISPFCYNPLNKYK